MTVRHIDWAPIRADYESGSPVVDIAAKFGVAARSIYRKARAEKWTRKNKPTEQERQTMGLESVGVVAKAINVTVARVYQLANEKIIPKPDHRGLWDKERCIRGYIGHLQALVRGRGSDGGIGAERLRKVRAEADKIELENALLQGKLVVLDDVRGFWTSAVMLVRSHLEGRCGRFAGQIAGMDDSAMIEDLLRDDDLRILSGLSARFASFGDGPGNGVPVVAAAEDAAVEVGREVSGSAA